MQRLLFQHCLSPLANPRQKVYTWLAIVNTVNPYLIG
jgi:hypothetical protein